MADFTYNAPMYADLTSDGASVMSPATSAWFSTTARDSPGGAGSVPKKEHTTPAAARSPASVSVKGTPGSAAPKSVKATPGSTAPASVKSTPVSAAPKSVKATPVSAAPAPVKPTPVSAAPKSVKATPVSAAPAPVKPTPVSAAPKSVKATPVSAAPAPFKPTPVSAAPAPVKPTPVSAASAPKPPSVAAKTTKASEARAAPTEPAAPPAAAPPKVTTLAKATAPTLSTSLRLGATKPALSTEELQMQAAARGIRASKQQRDKMLQQLDQVLAGSGTKALPARSTAPLTVPVAFEFSAAEGSRSAPASPRHGASPASAGRPGASPSHNKSLAEQVHDFTKTPKRFRGRAPNEVTTPLSASRSAPRLGTTSARAPELASEARAATRVTSTKSRDEMDDELMNSFPAFKVRHLP